MSAFSHIETKGCVTIEVSGYSDSNIETEGLQSDTQIDVTYPEMSIGVTMYSSGYIDTESMKTGAIQTVSISAGTISCGLVCGTDLGLAVLYASDGVLITIDGQYLIVQRS